MPEMPRSSPRHWFSDALTAFAFAALALAAFRSFGRFFGPFGTLFFLAVTLGLAYHFGRRAWSGLLEQRRPHK